MIILQPVYVKWVPTASLTPVRQWPGRPGFNPRSSHTKDSKMVLDDSLLNTQHYKVRIKGKVEQSREGVAPSPTPWCSSSRKGSLRVTLDYGRQLYKNNSESFILKNDHFTIRICCMGKYCTFKYEKLSFFSLAKFPFLWVKTHLSCLFSPTPIGQGLQPLRLLTGGLSLLPGTGGAPIKGNTDGAEGIFGNAGRVWATALQPGPP